MDTTVYTNKNLLYHYLQEVYTSVTVTTQIDLTKKKLQFCLKKYCMSKDRSKDQNGQNNKNQQRLNIIL